MLDLVICSVPDYVCVTDMLGTLSKRRFWQHERQPEVNLTFLTNHGAYFSLRGVRVVKNVACLRSLLPPDKATIFTDDHIVKLEISTSIKAPVKSNRSVYDCKKADFNGLRSALHAIDLSYNAFCDVKRG